MSLLAEQAYLYAQPLNPSPPTYVVTDILICPAQLSQAKELHI
jgi:hypothetical protein